MGCKASKGMEGQVNHQIEMAQRQAEKEKKKEFEILLLGTGDSGKTSKFSKRLIFQTTNHRSP
jgi:GTPase SAR1 family protein